MDLTKTIIPNDRLPLEKYLVSTCNRYASIIGIYELEVEEQMYFNDKMYTPIKIISMKNETLNKIGVNKILYVSDPFTVSESIHLRSYLDGEDFKSYLRTNNIDDILEEKN